MKSKNNRKSENRERTSYQYLYQNKVRNDTHSIICELIRRDPEVVCKISNKSSNGMMSWVSWHIHEDFLHLSHLRQKRYYYQGSSMSGKLTLSEIEHHIQSDTDAKHLLWLDQKCIFVDWTVHPSLQEYLTGSNSTLKTYLRESSLQPARKVKITPACWIPSDIFVGISIMEREDRNKVLSRISQQPGRWKLRDLEMVVKTFWRIVIGDCIAFASTQTSKRSQRGFNLSRFCTFYVKNDSIYVRMSSYIRSYFTDQERRPFHELPWGDKETYQTVVWSTIKKNHPNIHLSVRRELVLRIAKETNIDIHSVNTYFQYYEAHLLESIFTTGYVSLNALGSLELFVSEGENQIFFRLHNSSFLRRIVHRLKGEQDEL